MGNIEKLILTTKINDQVVDSSTILDEETKEALKHISKFTREILENEPKMNLSGQNSLKSEFLRYWNESITPDTENFWTALRDNAIDFERKEPLRFALLKNRFRLVQQGMDARNHWAELKKRKEITDNYSATEMAKIESVIEADENRRLEMFKKCLRKNELTQTEYFKFGEYWAYMSNCGLWDKNFTDEDILHLHNLRNNYKPKWEE